MHSKNLEQYIELVKKYEKVIWRIAVTYEARHELQKELFHEILLAIWQSLVGFKEQSRLSTYIYRVAHNTALRHVVKESRQIKLASSVDECVGEGHAHRETSPELLNEQAQLSEKLGHAMRCLPMEQRQLISMALDGLSYPQIADITGLSVSNVGVKLSRTKKRLARLMR